MKKIVIGFLVILFIGFTLTMPDFYGNDSYAKTGDLVQLFHDTMKANGHPVYDVVRLNFLIRKLAHFSMYCLITTTSISLFKMWTKRWWKAMLLGPLVTLAIAICDERIQMTMPGRTGQLMDVIIDFIGITFGALIMLIVSVTVDRGHTRVAQGATPDETIS